MFTVALKQYFASNFLFYQKNVLIDAVNQYTLMKFFNGYSLFTDLIDQTVFKNYFDDSLKTFDVSSL